MQPIEKRFVVKPGVLAGDRGALRGGPAAQYLNELLLVCPPSYRSQKLKKNGVKYFLIKKK